ncbi:hypothetical protein NIES267_71890 (plasmid) [Calothrix parasitica NIES-267]|uniref:Uncharacterized protein n=1 Tax=Calothrix parasitica NIES-267 TaxID=1973488 RepID=A0A1Z4M2I2_9CYAN|nr:hypothetical protein NIES267_71890 [Calothrix parasitica NIES-267]
MKILNFSIEKVINIKVANQIFDLHNEFPLQGYNYKTLEKTFELSFKGNSVYYDNWDDREVGNELITDLKIIFRNVKFLSIRDCPFDETNVCFTQMKFVNKMIEERPGSINEIENLVSSSVYADEIEPFGWEEFMYISFIYGVEILISSETVEANFNQFYNSSNCK